MTTDLIASIRPPRQYWQIHFACSDLGFQVVVRNAHGQLIDHATRGNHPSDPLKIVDPPDRLPFDELLTQAVATANAMAQEFRIPPENIRQESGEWEATD